MTISILLTGHAKWSEGMATAHNMIAGGSNRIQYLNFNVNPVPLEQFHIEMTDKTLELKDLSDEVWILTDIVGGYPFQIATQVSKEISNVRVFGGMNMPFLLALNLEKDNIPSSSIDKFINTLIEEAQTSLCPR